LISNPFDLQTLTDSLPRFPLSFSLGLATVTTENDYDHSSLGIETAFFEILDYGSFDGDMRNILPRAVQFIGLFPSSSFLPPFQLPPLISSVKILISSSLFPTSPTHIHPQTADHKERGNKVLVHCMAGMSRSTTVVLAFLIAHEKWSLKRAYHHSLCRRPMIFPNDGFWELFHEWERTHHGPEARGCDLYDRSPSLPLDPSL